MGCSLNKLAANIIDKHHTNDRRHISCSDLERGDVAMTDLDKKIPDIRMETEDDDFKTFTRKSSLNLSNFEGNHFLNIFDRGQSRSVYSCSARGSFDKRSGFGVPFSKSLDITRRSSGNTDNCSVILGIERPNIKNFTDFETDVLQSTWPLILAKSDEISFEISKTSLEIFPGLMKIFPYGAKSFEEFMKNEAYLDHAKSMLNLVNLTIETFQEEPDELYSKLVLIGARHATIPGMKTEYFKVIKRAILTSFNTVLAEEFTQSVQRVWTMILDYILISMSEGCLVFEEEEEKILQEIEDKKKDSSSQSSGNNIIPLNQIPNQSLELPNVATKRRSRPSVVSMSSEELAYFHAMSK